MDGLGSAEGSLCRCFITNLGRKGVRVEALRSRERRREGKGRGEREEEKAIDS